MEHETARDYSLQMSEQEYDPAAIDDKDLVMLNAGIIVQEIAWLEELLDQRIEELARPGASYLSLGELPPPRIDQLPAPYAILVRDLGLSPAERVLLITALAPHIAPDVLTNRLSDPDQPLRTLYTEAGGYVDSMFRNFVPSMQTVLFLISHGNRQESLWHHLALTQKSLLLKEQIITVKAYESQKHDFNQLNTCPVLAPEYIRYMQTGEKPRPDFGNAFPASYITTDLTWDHLVLPPVTYQEVSRLIQWLKAGKDLSRMDSGMLNHSFPCLFYGPPGTGKTLTAKLIGKTFNKMVFRIDLSMIVSKYIGETEKNLAHLFDRAAGKDWILFFDEADSLFGKRTGITDSKDKWANLEMSYLLQRMEEHTGLTILATNLKDNLDPALKRRFQAMIEFPFPGREERISLWRNSIPPAFTYHQGITMDKLSHLEVNGGHITNIIKSACLDAIHKKTTVLSYEDIMDAVKREMKKENRTL